MDTLPSVVAMIIVLPEAEGPNSLMVRISPSRFIFIDKNLLLVVGIIRNYLLCVNNFLPQDVGCTTDDWAMEGDKKLRQRMAAVEKLLI